MKLSDYVASFAEKKGIKEAFVLTGGCIVHIIDSIAKKKNTNIFIAKTSENAISSTEKVVNEYKKYRKRATQCVLNVVHTCKRHSGLLGCTERM